ncbi:MAG: ribonuclease P protein component [Verrucomicrobiales bacterium]
MNPEFTSKRLRFPQAARIKETWEFEKNRAEGSRFVMGAMIANWRVNPQQQQPRLGVITSKKVGGAVMRSRVRRLLREVFRLHQHEIIPVDLILIARPSIANKSMAEVEKNYLALLKQTRLYLA